MNNEHRCTVCGCPDGPDYGDPHECPPGFLTASGSVSVPAELREQVAREIEAHAAYSEQFNPAPAFMVGLASAAEVVRMGGCCPVDAVEQPSEDDEVSRLRAENERLRAEANDALAALSEAEADRSDARLGFDFKGRPLPPTAPAAPPSEPLCRCGHGPEHHDGKTGCIECGCRGFVWDNSAWVVPPRPSISDEAEAYEAFVNWYGADVGGPTGYQLKEAFVAGFRAARQEKA